MDVTRSSVTALSLPVAVFALAIGGCGGPPQVARGVPTTSISSTTSTTSQPGSPPISARLVLSEHSVKRGAVLAGNVVVDNATGHAIETSGCGSIFQVLLTSRTYRPVPGWLRCLQSVTIPPGHSRYAVKIEAFYNQCTRGNPSPTVPACLPTGLPPALPAGRYEATTFESSNVVPLPVAVSVRVTPDTHTERSRMGISSEK